MIEEENVEFSDKGGPNFARVGVPPGAIITAVDGESEFFDVIEKAVERRSFKGGDLFIVEVIDCLRVRWD